MLTFNGMDYRARTVAKPTVARYAMGDGTYRFIVVGTPYGHIHNLSGGVKTWGTYSGAYKAARRYQSIWG